MNRTHQSVAAGFSLLARVVACCFLSVSMLLSGSAGVSAAETGALLEADSFSVSSEGWLQWSQRAETAPVFFTAELPSLGGPGSLGLSGASNGAAHGCWYRLVSGIEGGGHYRFEAAYFCRFVPYPRQQVFARLDWRSADGRRVGQPEYVPEAGLEGGWQKVGGVFQAPERASAVRLELFLSHADQGSAWWDGIRLDRVPAPGKRMVRVGTVNCYPRGKAASAESVEEFCRQAEEAGRRGCDIVCLGEGINLVGVRGGVGYPDVAEPIPGPTTSRLGELARKWKMYIVAALGEREGHAVYNTAVLIDRQGRVAGKYRKVYLPREEYEAGVAPGNSYPVFDTDFGRIGMMICWDVQYVDPARALALQGAEIIFLPIWDGSDFLIKARPVENSVYLVTCGYGTPSAVYDPWGKVLAEAGERPGVAIAEIDLNRPLPDEWLGNMRLRFLYERRADIVVPALER